MTDTLVSFDIDGTLETGDPPGPVPLTLVRRALERGYVVGSASDRTLAAQRRMWDDHDIAVAFVSHKHHLDAVRSRFSCSRLVHIGDTTVDEHYATLAGFEFWLAHAVPADGTRGWIF